MSEEARKREDDYYAGTMKDDYISRKAVLDMLEEECGSCADTGYIFSLPGIEKRKTGRWINDCTCSICHWIHDDEEGFALLTNYHFCPNCGADMRGDLAKIDALPSAQPEIIHCESCEHWKNEHLCECLSRHGTFETPKNFYCGYGKEK